ncbi:rho GTPase-activating protein 27 [Hippocampus zosterae]|uniref:rho GTPase-activating protein 27 n=1 Tax=Hippocampus zosterae TaxID=109293 RepID=UPI00223D5555|nr:rho GTPase-activating protein 27 [Hippocampus zosterae]
MATTPALLGKGVGLVLVEFQYEYKGRDGSIISIKPNERYVLLAKTNAHWWQVRRDHTSKPFYIPAKYVKELPPDAPSPLDFAHPPPPEATPVPTPVVTPVPVSVPVPKVLEEPGGTRSKLGDEVPIRLKPDMSGGYRKTENRMSTFGVPLDFLDLPPPLATVPRHSGAPLGPDCADKTDGVTVKTLPEEHRNIGFIPADPPAARPHTLPIPVDTPTIPDVQALKESEGGPSQEDREEAVAGRQEMEQEEEEETIEATEDSEQDSDDPEEIEEHKEEKESNHIYESIQDLHLDALIGELNPAPPPNQQTCDPASEPSQLPDPAPSTTGPTLSSSSTSSEIISLSPLSPTQQGWQMHTDKESGRVFYFHPLTRQSTWSHPRSPSPQPSSPPVSSLVPSASSPTPSPQSGCEIWEQLMDQNSGRLYYYNPVSGATSWNAPMPAPHAAPTMTDEPTKPVDGPPPLPEEDYPVDAQPDNDTVFMMHARQHIIPRAHLERQDGLRMANGKPDQRVAWRHSVAEDTFASRHWRNLADISRDSPDTTQLCDRLSLRRNLSDRSSDSQQGHLLEKAGIVNKTKVVDNGKKIRKNWSQSWTVLHGGILTFHRDPKSAPSSNMGSQIVPEYTVELRGASVCWAPKEKSSKKNVLELRTRQGCEYLMQYDTESIIADWLKVVQDTIRQLDHEHTSDDDDDGASDKENKDRKRASNRSLSGADAEQTRVRTKLRRFLQRRPTLQSVKEKGYIRDNVFGCHLDTLCHRENTTIPKFVEKCIKAVERRGLDVDGIYRVSGNLAVIQKLRHKADHEEHLDVDDGQWEDIHVLTGALKLFLRELPEPLFPFSFFDKFIAAIQIPDYSLRVSYMKDLVRSLPLPNHDTMELLFRHLLRVVEHKDANRMSVQSMAIVFGPTLLRPQTESANMTIHMVFQSQIVELMLNEFHTVFVQR